MIFSHDQSFAEALELHENLLFAESQAISCRDLAVVEDLLSQKEESLSGLVAARKELGTLLSKDLHEKFSNLLQMQRKNTENFRKLHQGGCDLTPKPPQTKYLSDRLKNAYSR